MSDESVFVANRMDWKWKMMRNTAPSDELVCRLHLIWMSDSHDDQKVRILLVTTGGVPAVYEGLGTWSYYSDWIRNLLNNEEATHDKTPRWKTRRGNGLPVRNRFTTLPELRISTSELVSHGFYRVDD